MRATEERERARRVGEAARGLRRQATPAERHLWQFLRRHQLGGLGFRRQHPIGPFVVDFACPGRKLVVELDGPVHEDQRGQDDERSRCLEAWGWTVIRFTNDEALNQTDTVLRNISETALALPELR